MQQFLGKANEINHKVTAFRRQAGQSEEAGAAALGLPLEDCLGALGELQKLGCDLGGYAVETNAGMIASERNHADLIRNVLWGVTDGKLHLCDCADSVPSPAQPLEDPMSLDAPEAVRSLRHLVHRASEVAAMSDERRDALEVAVGEAAVNAVVHASGGTATVGADPNGKVQVRVTDRGSGIPMDQLPRVLLEMGYSLAGSSGFGLKIVLRTVDKIHFHTGPTGTTLLLEQRRA